MIRAEDNELSWNSMKHTSKIVSINDFSMSREKHIAQLDFDKLLFPLQIRSWQEGDIFSPMGMKGKKKVSDFFVSEKTYFK